MHACLSLPSYLQDAPAAVWSSQQLLRAHSIALTGTPTSFWPAGEWELDDSKRLCVYMLERAISQLPEGQETVLGIFDLRGFKNKNADLGFVRFLVGSLKGSDLEEPVCSCISWIPHLAVLQCATH